jgi:hypothetical protein
MSPHIAVAMVFAATSNVSLMVLPLTTAALHFMYKYNHLKQMTLYMDMQQLNRNENFAATFDKVREVLLTHESLALFITQEPDSTDLVFENPFFAPYAYE